MTPPALHDVSPTGLRAHVEQLHQKRVMLQEFAQHVALSWKFGKKDTMGKLFAKPNGGIIKIY